MSFQYPPEIIDACAAGEATRLFEERGPELWAMTSAQLDQEVARLHEEHAGQPQIAEGLSEALRRAWGLAHGLDS